METPYSMKLFSWLAIFVSVAVGGVSTAGSQTAFADDLQGWVVEQVAQPGASVTVRDGALVIDDKAGVTVWRREPLRAPARIRFTATLPGGEDRRVSDLNCFWMASDPRSPGDFFDVEKTGRDGRFATYDGLRTYYVGCGGNGNTTTRFRRYDGRGARPLLPEHDRKETEALLEKDRHYRIEITVDAHGRTTWARDGVVWFEYQDPEPLREGWFGFRTVWSRIEIRDFSVEMMPDKASDPEAAPSASSLATGVAKD